MRMNFICDRCGILFDSNDAYEDMLIAIKITVGYELQHYCYNCGKRIHDALNAILDESGAEHE